MSDSGIKVTYFRAMLISFIQLESGIVLSLPFLKGITIL